MATITIPGMFLTGDHASRPAASAVGSGSVYSCTTHGLIYQSDGASWTTWATLGETGLAAHLADTSDAHDASAISVADAGSYFAGADVEAALQEVGASLGSGGIPAGTSFPGSPATGALFHRTDLTPGLYRYDGTRWLCACPHVETMGQGDVLDHAGTDTGPYKRLALPPSRDIYLTKWKIITQVDSTNDGTKYWTVTMRNVAAGAFASSNVSSFNTSADTQAQAVRHDQAVNSAITVSGRAFLDVIAVKTSTPGAIRLPCSIEYHFIAT